MFTIAVITGSTVNFDFLIKFIINKKSINRLSELGIKTLYVQYGNENYSKKFFDDLINKYFQDFERTEQYINDENFSFIKSIDLNFSIIGFLYSKNLKDIITKTDLVITHGGTGSILDCLYLLKNIIVVVNEDLMQNHQLEISKKFFELNYFFFFKSKSLHNDNTINEFFNCISDLLNKKIILTKFQKSNEKKLELILNREL